MGIVELEIVEELRKELDDPNKNVRTNKESFIDTRNPRFMKNKPYIHVAQQPTFYNRDAIGSTKRLADITVLINIFVEINQRIYVEALDKSLESGALLVYLEQEILRIITEKTAFLVEKYGYRTIELVESRSVVSNDVTHRREITVNVKTIKGKETYT